jgi:hypothetical protein
MNATTQIPKEVLRGLAIVAGSGSLQAAPGRATCEAVKEESKMQWRF